MDELIPEGKLGRPGDLLGQGARARTFALSGPAPVDLSGALVFRRYRTPRPAAPLAELVRRRRQQAADVRDELDAGTLWPISIVVDDTDAGRAVGVVTARLGDGFLLSVDRDPRRPPRRLVAQPGDRSTTSASARPDRVTRLRLCRQVARTVALVHDPALHVALGANAIRSIVHRTTPTPAALVVHCDDAAPDGDPSADLTELARLVHGCLFADHRDRDEDADGAGLGSAGRTLADRVASGDPDALPTASEWWRVLDRALGITVAPPVLESAEPERTLAGVGQAVVVRWRASDVTEVRVSGPSCPEVRVAVDGPERLGSGTVEVRPERSGPLDVTVVNELGADHLRTRPVFVQDMPSLADLPVPMPLLAWPQIVPPLPDVSSVLPPVPHLVSPASQTAPDVAGLWPAPAPAPPPPSTVDMVALPLDPIHLHTGLPPYPAPDAVPES